MDIRSVDIGAGLDQQVFIIPVSCIGADAGTIDVIKTLPFEMEVTEVRMVLTSKLATAGATHLLRVTDGTNNIVADQTYALADTIGTEKIPALVSANVRLQGTDKLTVVSTAGGTASTAGQALVVIKYKKIGEKS